MQSAQLQALSESSLAAKPQLSEKPRQGFSTKKTASHQGPSVCNFTVTLGLQAVVVENGVRKTYSARYYNPATGRFLSRDPEDGYANNPASLHKYLYADGDPVNGRDPSGRDDLAEAGETNNEVSVAAEKEEVALEKRVECMLETVTATLLLALATPPGEVLEYLAPDPAKCGAKRKLCKLGGEIGAVVVGETMARLIPYAQSIGAGFYIPPPDAPPSMWMQNNREWINDVMDQGCKILDGKIDGDRTPSPYYEMELGQIAERGYPTTPVSIPSIGSLPY